jgi:hypothetical protein
MRITVAMADPDGVQIAGCTLQTRAQVNRLVFALEQARNIVWPFESLDPSLVRTECSVRVNDDGIETFTAPPHLKGHSP